VGFPGGADTIAIKRVNADTTTQTVKRDGKVITQGTRVVSKDGKVETIHAKGKDSDGKPISNLVVYEKQQIRGEIRSPRENMGCSSSGSPLVLQCAPQFAPKDRVRFHQVRI